MEGTPPMSSSEDETGVKLIIIIIIRLHNYSVLTLITPTTQTSVIMGFQCTAIIDQLLTMFRVKLSISTLSLVLCCLNGPYLH